MQRPNRSRAVALQAMGGYLNTSLIVVQGLLLVPLYIRYLGPRSYGLWVASGGILGILNVVNLGFGTLLIQRVAAAYGEGNRGRAATYFVNGFAVYLFLASLFVAAGMAASLWICGFLKAAGAEAERLRHCFQLAVAATGVGLVNECLRGFSQALLRPLFPACNLAVGRVASLAATLYLLCHGAGLWAIPAGMAVAESVVLCAAVVQGALLLRMLGERASLQGAILKEYLHTGSALFAARLGNVLSGESEPLLIAVLLRPEAAAAYMVARKGADLVFRLASVINAASQGAFSHLVGEGDRERTGSVALRLISVMLLVGVVGFACYVAFNASFVAVWVGKGYVQEQVTTLLVGVAFFLGGMRNMLLLLLNGLGAFLDNSKIILLEGGAKIALAALLLKVCGVPGVPLAGVISAGVSLCVLWNNLRSRIELPLTGGEPVKGGMGALAAFGVAQAFASLTRPASSPLGFFLTAAVGGFALASLAMLLTGWSVREIVSLGRRAT